MKNVSACCKATVRIYSSGDRKYSYFCTQCQQACDMSIVAKIVDTGGYLIHTSVK